MSDDKDYTWIVCVRVDDTSRIFPGASLDWCAYCDRAIWVHPDSYDVMPDLRQVLVCIRCLGPAAAADPSLDAEARERFAAVSQVYADSIDQKRADP